MSPLTSAVLVVMGVGVVAWLLRRTSGSEGIDKALLSGREPAPGSANSAAAEPEAEPEAADDTDEWGDDEPAPQDLLAITSNGEVFLPYSGGLHVLPLGEAREQIAAGVASWEDVKQRVVDALRIAEGTGRLSTQFSPGDFNAGRVKRGAPGTEPWRLELLGRDGEYIAYVFETEEAARTALAMLERCGTIHRPVDDSGEPVPASAEDFEEARRLYDEAVAELATMPESEAEDASQVSSVGGPAPPLEAPPEREPIARPPVAAGEVAAEVDAQSYLPPEEGRDWLVAQLAGLIGRAGPDAFLCAPLVTPSDHYFPDPWRGDAESVRKLADRLLGYARLDGYSAVVELLPEPGQSQELGPGTEIGRSVLDRSALAQFYGIEGSACRFGIARSALRVPELLAGAMAHETAHAWRAVRGLIGTDKRMEEALTDLTTVYLGFGLLTTNASYLYHTAGWQQGVSAVTQWTHTGGGYLSPQAMCFLLAVQAVVCDLQYPRLEHWLATTQRAYFGAGIEAIEDQRDELIQRLGLPAEDRWPDPWNAPGAKGDVGR